LELLNVKELSYWVVLNNAEMNAYIGGQMQALTDGQHGLAGGAGSNVLQPAPQEGLPVLLWRWQWGVPWWPGGPPARGAQQPRIEICHHLIG